jgi:hypothetical protein
MNPYLRMCLAKLEHLPRKVSCFVVFAGITGETRTYLGLLSTRLSQEESFGADRGNIRPDVPALTPSTLRILDLRQHRHPRKL